MKLNKILNIEFPFIQGGMANIATGEFAAAVSNAGGLGLIGAGGMTLEMFEENVRICKSLTDKPFGANLMLMNPHSDDMAKVIIRENIPVVTTGAGNPSKYIEDFKKAGIKIFPVVPSVALAKRLARAGVDGIIAEGSESGGHIGDMTTMALVPQVVRAVDIPVIAAGGVAIGEQLLAAHALGACGVQLGTLLLGAEECPIHENYKNAILNASANDTTVTGRSVGVPVRILKNNMTREYLKLEATGADKMELEKFTLGSLRKAVFEGDIKNGSLMAGQVAGLVENIRPLREIFESLMTEYNSRLKELDCEK